MPYVSEKSLCFAEHGEFVCDLACCLFDFFENVVVELDFVCALFVHVLADCGAFHFQQFSNMFLRESPFFHIDRKVFPEGWQDVEDFYFLRVKKAINHSEVNYG